MRHARGNSSICRRRAAVAAVDRLLNVAYGAVNAVVLVQKDGGRAFHARLGHAVKAAVVVGIRPRPAAQSRHVRRWQPAATNVASIMLRAARPP